MTDENVILPDIVTYYLGEKQQSTTSNSLKDFEGMKLNEAKDRFERMFLMQKLKEHDYNISQTAQILGIYPSNLHGKIKKFNIEIKK
jgi:two-component system nitrogen regulation response regulator NtrX